MTDEKGPRLIMTPAPGESDAAAGAWVIPDADPKVRDVSLGMTIGSVLQALPPAAFRGPDRLRFVSALRTDADGNMVIEHDSVPVHVRVDPAGKPFVLLGDDERFPVLVAPMRWHDGEDLDAARDRLVKLVKRRDADARRYERQAAARERVGLFGVPSETVQLLSLPVTHGDTRNARRGKLFDGERALARVEQKHSPPDIKGARRVIGGRVTIELDPESRAAAWAERRRGKQRKTAQLVLPFDQVTGDAAELVPLAWQVLQHLHPDALLTLLAGLAIASREEGVFPAAASIIGRERHLIRPSGELDTPRRRELVGHLELLQQVHLLVTPYGGKSQDRLPLLVPQGTRTIAGVGTPVPLLSINMVLWERMRRGRELVMDRRVLMFRPRDEEWALRLYWQFAVRWNLGWVGQGLRKTGGTIEVPLVELLDRSGLQWRDQLQARGQQWVLERVERALETLRGVEGGAMALAELVGDGTVAGSRVKATPPATLAEQLTTKRRGTIELVDEREAGGKRSEGTAREVRGDRAKGPRGPREGRFAK